MAVSDPPVSILGSANVSRLINVGRFDLHLRVLSDVRYLIEERIVDRHHRQQLRTNLLHTQPIPQLQVAALQQEKSIPILVPVSETVQKRDRLG